MDLRTIGAVVSSSVSQNDFDCDDLGANSISYTVFDASGNSNSVNFTVTVVDTIKPVMASPMADIQVGFCDSIVNYVVNVVTDNCGATFTSLVSGLGSGSDFPVGTTTNVISVKDGSDNEILVSFDVTVLPAYLPRNFPDLQFCELDAAVDLSLGEPNLSFSGTGVAVDNKTFDPQVAGAGNFTISLEFQDSMGCTNTHSFQADVESLPEPTIQRIASTQLRVDQEYEGYLWFKDGEPLFGERNRTLFVKGIGQYQVRVESSNGCLGYSNAYGFGVQLGVENLRLDHSIKVFPNPANDRLTISFGSDEKQLRRYSITDQLGRELINFSNSDHQQQLDISPLSVGLYRLSIEENGQVFRFTFIKNPS